MSSVTLSHLEGQTTHAHLLIETKICLEVSRCLSQFPLNQQTGRIWHFLNTNGLHSWIGCSELFCSLHIELNSVLRISYFRDIGQKTFYFFYFQQIYIVNKNIFSSFYMPWKCACTIWPFYFASYLQPNIPRYYSLLYWTHYLWKWNKKNWSIFNVCLLELPGECLHGLVVDSC